MKFSIEGRIDIMRYVEGFHSVYASFGLCDHHAFICRDRRNDHRSESIAKLTLFRGRLTQISIGYFGKLLRRRAA